MTSQNNCCVYVLKNKNTNKCDYVGHTTQPARRARDHSYQWNAKYIFIMLMSKTTAQEYERVLIARLKKYGQAKINKNAAALQPRGARYTEEKRGRQRWIHITRKKVSRYPLFG